jgi:predicted nucleic acid-binding protein
MIVVSDTSPLNYLVLLEAVEVLPQLFTAVHCPLAVLQELRHPRAPDRVKTWSQNPPAWLSIQEPQARPTFANLDAGEAAALALAVELGADALLIDEKKGRRVAKAQGLVTIGTITVLELAAEAKLIELRPALDALQQTTFQITQAYIDAALAREAARKQI